MHKTGDTEEAAPTGSSWCGHLAKLGRPTLGVSVGREVRTGPSGGMSQSVPVPVGDCSGQRTMFHGLITDGVKKAERQSPDLSSLGHVSYIYLLCLSLFLKTVLSGATGSVISLILLINIMKNSFIALPSRWTVDGRLSYLKS